MSRDYTKHWERGHTKVENGWRNGKLVKIENNVKVDIDIY